MRLGAIEGSGGSALALTPAPPVALMRKAYGVTLGAMFVHGVYMLFALPVDRET